jgi:HlyD family secretion protein
MKKWTATLIVCVPLAIAGCHRGGDAASTRATGYVEATDVRVAPEVGGRLVKLEVVEGQRLAAGDVVGRLDTADTELAVQRASAERAQAQAQLALLQAGSRAEDIRQAAAQLQSAQSEIRAAQAELQAAVVAGAEERARAAADALARLKAGARPQELAAARARVSAVDAQIASLRKNLDDAIVKSPVGGVVTSKLIDAGEMVAPRAAIVVVTDLDHAWANVYVDEPLVPQLKIGQSATLVTDAGQRIDGTITFISPKAEFTPRNVQTAEERSKLVYRIKVTADNHNGVLKPGMPVEAELQPQKQ